MARVLCQPDPSRATRERGRVRWATSAARMSKRSSRSASESASSGPGRAAGQAPRRPVVGQRDRGRGRPRVADRPGGVRRPSRDRPRDAAALRIAKRAHLRRVRRGRAVVRGSLGARGSLAAPAAPRSRPPFRRLLRPIGGRRGPALPIGGRSRSVGCPLRLRVFETLCQPIHPVLRRGPCAALPVRRLVVGRSSSRRGALRCRGSSGFRRRCRGERCAQRGPLDADRASSIASSDPCSLKSSAAVFSPTPFAPGMPSDGSPRRAMKSGTSSGPMP